MLMNLAGAPLLSYAVNSLVAYGLGKQVIVATSTDQSDDAIENWCVSNEIECFRGDLNNVAERFRDCLEENPCEYAMRICGDNVFVSHEILDTFFKKIESSSFGFLTNTFVRTFPYGMSVEVVSRKLFLDSYANFNQEGDFEHVMPYFYRNAERIKTQFVENKEYPQASELKLAVDTRKDLLRVQRMITMTDQAYYKLNLGQIAELYHHAENS